MPHIAAYILGLSAIIGFIALLIDNKLKKKENVL
jgi:hypothetical protein